MLNKPLCPDCGGGNNVTCVGGVAVEKLLENGVCTVCTDGGCCTGC